MKIQIKKQTNPQENNNGVKIQVKKLKENAILPLFPR